MRISESINETIAQLDRLHEGRRTRVAADFEALRQIVVNLEVPFDASFDASLVDEPAVGDAGGLGRPVPSPRQPARPPVDAGYPGLASDRALRGKLLAELTSDRGKDW
jgi:hypothetical protein